MELITDVAVNLAANVIFWLGLGAVVALYVRAGQRRFRTFFGIRRGSVVRIVMSNLWHPDRGRRPVGYSVALHELRGAQLIEALFSSSSRLPDLVKGLVDSVFLRNTDYSHRTEVSPARADDVSEFLSEPGTLIILGGADRNLARRSYAGEQLLTARLYDKTDLDGRKVAYAKIESGKCGGKIIETPPDRRLAIIERFYDRSRDGRLVIHCAGYGGDATWAACHYLAENWRSVAKEFKDEPFAIVVGFKMKDYEFHYKGADRLFVVRP